MTIRAAIGIGAAIHEAHDAGMIEAGENLPLLHKLVAELSGIESRPQNLHSSFDPHTIFHALGAIDHTETAFAHTFEQLPTRHANEWQIGREELQERDFEKRAGSFIGGEHPLQLTS